RDPTSVTAALPRGQDFLEGMAGGSSVSIDSGDPAALATDLTRRFAEEANKSRSDRGDPGDSIALERALRILRLDHAQCGARGGSFLNTMTEFIRYARLLSGNSDSTNLVPAIELMEGYVVSIDLTLLKSERKLAWKIYTPEGFSNNLR